MLLNNIFGNLNEYDLYWDVKVDDNNIIKSVPFLKNIYIGHEINYSQEHINLFIDKLIELNSEYHTKIIIENNLYILHSIALLDTVDSKNCKYINFLLNLINLLFLVDKYPQFDFT